MLVKSSVAAAQLDADAQHSAVSSSPTGLSAAGEVSSVGKPGEVQTKRLSTPTGEVSRPAPQLKRFHAAVTIDPLRLGRDASQIAEEIVQHLTRVVGSQVEITLEIRADLPDGASEKLVRDVTENCRTLRFKSYGFEES